MTENKKNNPSDGQGLSTASLTLGILAILTSLVWYIGTVLGMLAIAFGIASLKGRSRKKAIAGITTGSIGVALCLLFVLLVQAALPALQKNQRDTMRRNDVSVVVSDVMMYQTSNQGKLPQVGELSTANLTQITSIMYDGEPTTNSAVYVIGKNCDDIASENAYKINVRLENDSIYCQGS